MASGLPIMCSKYAGCYLDLVTPENGLVFDPLAPKGFAKALAEFWDRRDRWAGMGAASQRIVSTYTFAATADAVVRAAKAALIARSETVLSTPPRLMR